MLLVCGLIGSCAFMWLIFFINLACTSLQPAGSGVSVKIRSRHRVGRPDMGLCTVSSHGALASSASAIFLSLGARMEPMMSCSGCCSSSGVQSTARSDRPAKMTLKSGSPRASVLWVEHMMKAMRSRACSAHAAQHTQCIRVVHVQCTCSVYAVYMQCVHVQSRGHDHQGGAARLQAKKLRELPGEAEAGDVPRGEERACVCSAHAVRMQCVCSAHAVRIDGRTEQRDGRCGHAEAAQEGVAEGRVHDGEE